MAPSVIAAMQEVVLAPGNPASLHADGQIARRRHEDAARAVERWVHAPDRSRVVFTGGGAEANLLAVMGFARALLNEPRRRNVLFSTPMPVLQDKLAELGFASASLDEGLSDDVAFVVLTPGDDVRAVCLAARSHGVAVHLDATRSAVALDMADLGVDCVALAGATLGGPLGVGALVLRQGLVPAPLWDGGGQEFGMRPGTPAVALTVGMGQAVRERLEQTT